MTADEVFDECTHGFSGRKYAAGLLVAFVDFLRDLSVPGSGIQSFSDFLTRYPRKDTVPGGGPANTLIVDKGNDQTLSIRPFYNEIERHFHGLGRFDYPSCAPHATQAWKDYTHWLDALCGMDDQGLLDLRDRVCQFVLAELPDQRFDPATVLRVPPLFEMVLKSFDLTRAKGEPTGAAYQGIVFGFLRADNPHLQLEIRKVRTGSRRQSGVGDIDGWDGDRLAISAEVKQYRLSVSGIAQLASFFHAVNDRGAIGIVAALAFDDDCRDAIRDAGLHALDIQNFRDITGLWDPAKQRIAVQSLLYYVKHVEQNSALSKRLEDFLSTSLSGVEGRSDSNDDVTDGASTPGS